jgi:hypothetical protein
VTRILANGVKEDAIPTLCSELSRCCGHKIIVSRENNQKQNYCLTPQDDIIIKDIPSTWNFLSINLTGFVEDIAFSSDEQALFKKDLLEKLFEKLEKCTTQTEIDSIKVLISYISLENYVGCCETEDCTNLVSIQSIVTNLSLLCDNCRK